MLELLPETVSPLRERAVLFHDIGKPASYSFDPVDQRIPLKEVLDAVQSRQ